MKPSQIWLVACIAAEEELPAESRALIKRHDSLHRAWSGQSPVPADLVKAAAAIKADPFASVAMEIRRRGNDAAFKEREAERAITPEQAAYALREAAQ